MTKQAVLSLSMVVSLIDRRWYIEAPWLDDPVEGDTFEDAYAEALRRR